MNRLSLLNLPEEILEVLRQGKLEYTKAKAIGKVKNPDQRKKLLTEVISQNWSLSRIRKRVKELEGKREDSKSETLKHQFEKVYEKIDKANLWENPEKQKRFEEILQRLENLLKGE